MDRNTGIQPIYKYKHLFTAVQKEGYEHLDIIEAL